LTSLLDCLADAGDVLGAEALFASMRLENIKFDPFIYSSMITLYGKHGQPNKAVRYSSITNSNLKFF